jgi:hypothetical protein
LTAGGAEDRAALKKLVLRIVELLQGHHRHHRLLEEAHRGEEAAGQHRHRDPAREHSRAQRKHERLAVEIVKLAEKRHKELRRGNERSSPRTSFTR